MSFRQEQAKGKAPAPPYKPIAVFELHTDKLKGADDEEGSFACLLKSIYTGALTRSEAERDTPEKLRLLGPAIRDGKPVLPSTKENFVVRVIGSDEQRICLLFSWNTLYNDAFYVDDEEVQANRCWYVGQTFDRSILKGIKVQFPHESVLGQGIFVLTTNENYASLGPKEIMLGKDAIDGYVRKMYTVRERMTLKNGKLCIGADLKEELRKGPLAFGPVVIAEASRFLDYQQFLLGSIDSAVRVPLSYSKLFTHWSNFSISFKNRHGFRQFTADQVASKIAILCSSILQK